MKTRVADLAAKVAVIGLLLVMAGACGYRPAATVLSDDRQRSAVVPAFETNTGSPELEVFAGEHLASRLTALGISARSDNDGANTIIRGRIVSTREVPLGLHADQTTVQIELDTQVEVSQDGREPCLTSIATGMATLSVPFDASSEPARLATMQSAVADAIEQLLLEVLLCVQSLDDA